MHPEIIREEPGSCPICGMDLVPMEPTESEEDKTYQKLLKKMKIAVLFTVPIFIIAMADLIPGNPLTKLFPQFTWNWIQLILSLPVVFHACWMFFERAWKSIVTMNLNMFTLISIGTGVAWLFGLVAMFFPDVFPDQFKTEAGTVFVYFEATTVILTLVLLGQLLEARAHSQTSGAIKELLKLAPTEATLVTPEDDTIISIHNIKKGNLLGIVKATNLGKAVMKNIKQNLFFAFIYNILGVPVAAGLLYPVFGILLSPMIAALAMSFSSVSVIANALRLRNIKI
jgi:Cu2+-exporting ATPase